MSVQSFILNIFFQAFSFKVVEKSSEPICEDEENVVVIQVNMYISLK